uniref:Uncharacterized protein n=1 Tax=Anguilla anguilla TaxID=7936 RepID=A0A0E9RVU5_ANGAN
MTFLHSAFQRPFHMFLVAKLHLFFNHNYCTI